jgi:hypothetical protein
MGYGRTDDLKYIWSNRLLLLDARIWPSFLSKLWLCCLEGLANGLGICKRCTKDRVY